MPEGSKPNASDPEEVLSFWFPEEDLLTADVVACDMAHVPLDDETLDVAIFALSLMGTNFTDYLREAHRTLKLDGHLHIIESTSRFTDQEQFVENLRGLGFVVVSVEDRWKFTHIRAMKTEVRPLREVELRF